MRYMRKIILLARFKKALQDPDRKSIFKILKEYIYYKATNPALAEQYFNKYLYNKHTKDPDNFIITSKMMTRAWGLNDEDYIPLLRNKQATEIFFARQGIPVIKSFMYNMNKIFFIGEESFYIKTHENFIDLLKKLKTEGYWKTPALIIKKTEDSSQGYNIFRLHENEISRKELIESVFKNIIKSRFLFQEFIQQHPDLNKINPNAVNTLRIDTFTDAGKNLHVINAALRISSGKAYLDSAPLGGIQAGINLKNGTLHGEAFGDFENGFARIYTVHPLTGIQFAGFKIPFYEEAINLAVKAAKELPEIRIAGWDVAVTHEGPVLVEGNNFPGLAFSEISQKGFKRNPIVERMLKESLSYV
jgi:hypothetical protein